MGHTHHYTAKTSTLPRQGKRTRLKIIKASVCLNDCVAFIGFIAIHFPKGRREQPEAIGGKSVPETWKHILYILQ